MVMCHSPSHLMRWFLIGEGLAGIVDGEGFAVAAEFPRVEEAQRFIHFKNRVNRAFHYTRDIADDVRNRHEILVIDAFLDDR